MGHGLPAQSSETVASTMPVAALSWLVKWKRTAIAVRTQAMACQHDDGADAHLKGTLIAHPEPTDSQHAKQIHYKS